MSHVHGQEPPPTNCTVFLAITYEKCSSRSWRPDSVHPSSRDFPNVATTAPAAPDPPLPALPRAGKRSGRLPGLGEGGVRGSPRDPRGEGWHRNPDRLHPCTWELKKRSKTAAHYVKGAREQNPPWKVWAQQCLPLKHSVHPDSA